MQVGWELRHKVFTISGPHTVAAEPVQTGSSASRGLRFVYHGVVRLNRTLSSAAAAVSAAAAMVLAPALLPHQSPGVLAVSAAASCPDVEVIFARGRMEPRGHRPDRQRLRQRAALQDRQERRRSTRCDYPADTQIDIGANDMSARIQYMAANCPDTRLVLGGYSLGAAVTDVVLAVALRRSSGSRIRCRPASIRHIAAVALFGNGTPWVGPIANFSPLYRERTDRPVPRRRSDLQPDRSAELGRQLGRPPGSRPTSTPGMVNQAADFVAGRHLTPDSSVAGRG